MVTYNQAPARSSHSSETKNKTSPKGLSLLFMFSLVVLTMCAIAGTVLQESSFTATAPVFAWLVNLSVTSSIAVASWYENIGAQKLGAIPPRMGSAIFAPLVLMAVTLPSISLVWRTRTANVEKLTGTELATPDALSFSLLLFSACLVSFWIGEGLFKSSRVMSMRSSAQSYTDSKWRQAQVILMLIGLTISLSKIGGDRAIEFSERGTQVGQGVLVLAWWCLPLGIALGFLFRHWNSKLRLAMSILGIALIVNSGVRSPLLLIAVACIPLLLQRIARSNSPIQVWSIAIAGGYLLITLGGAISAWRGSIRYGTPIPLGQALLHAAGDPLRTLTSSGLDTVDGLLLVYSLPPTIIDANLLDLFKVLQTMIPSQFYPDKPEFISNIISRELLGFGTAGMFMSGPGYLILIGGSWLAAILLFGLGGVTYRLIVTRRAAGAAWLIATYTLIRFVMGGDAFDFYQGLTLVGISATSLAAAAFISGVEKRLHVPKTFPREMTGASRD